MFIIIQAGIGGIRPLLRVPLSVILDKALKIIPDEEISLEIITNAVNRLKVRIIDWDKSKCKKCQLCIPDCPTGCISFDGENDTIVRDKDRCLRCNICYQTCPFSMGARPTNGA